MSSPLWSDVVSRLDPYVPGEQPVGSDLVKLNTNENPYPPSPAVLSAITHKVGENLRLYPPPESDELVSTIAGYFGVKSSQVFVGNGSDEVLAHCFQAFFTGRKDKLLFPDISYSFYPVYCGLFDIAFNKVPLADDFTIDFSQYPEQNGGIIFPNPNAPTGIGLPLQTIEQVLSKYSNSLVVVDEAYVDFGCESAIQLVDRFPNLLVIQTLSKSRSLAGMRVGYAIGNEDLIEGLNRVKNSFNSYPLDQLAIAGAVASFGDDNYFQVTRGQIIANREILAEELGKRAFKVLPSQANFVFAKHQHVTGSELAAALRKEGVIVRHFGKARIEDYLRITVGTEKQQERLFGALDKALANII